MAVSVLRPTASTPLDRLVTDYLSACEGRGLVPKSIGQDERSLLANFLPWCAEEGVTRVDELDRAVLDRYTSYLLHRPTPSGAPLSRFSVHTYIRPVRLMLTWAAREGESVAAKPQFPRREKPFRDVLSREELDAVERAAAFERDKVIIRVFADCGLRLHELTQLCASDVIRSGRQAHLRVLGKRGRVRDVPIPPTLLRRLERLIDGRPEERDSDRIFLAIRRGSRGLVEPLTDGGIYQIVTHAVRQAGIRKRVHPHLLRHSWMTEMLRNGMNPIQLSFIAGASTEVIAQHYAHLTRDDAYDAMLAALSARPAGRLTPDPRAYRDGRRVL